MSIRILRLPQVLDTTGLKRSTLYDLLKAHSFPKPIQLSSKSVGWVEAMLDKVQASLQIEPSLQTLFTVRWEIK